VNRGNGDKWIDQEKMERGTKEKRMERSRIERMARVIAPRRESGRKQRLLGKIAGRETPGEVEKFHLQIKIHAIRCAGKTMRGIRRGF